MPADNCLSSLHRADYDRLCLLFRNAHSIAMHSKSFKDFVWLCSLDEKKGLKIGNTYRNDKQCKLFIKTIANNERNKIRDYLSEVKFITLLSDGSVDVSVTENEAIYVRCCKEGKVDIFFIEMAAVQRANAQGIFDALRRALTSVDSGVFNNNPLKLEDKVVCFTGDGASVNSGYQNGVIAKLKQLSQEIIFVHCLNHRLELALKQAMKGHKLYEKINSLLSEIFKFYHTSSLQTENLKTAYEACNVPVQLPHRIGGTRWVSHMSGALEQIWKGYKVFVQHLDQVIFHYYVTDPGNFLNSLHLLMGARCSGRVLASNL